MGELIQSIFLSDFTIIILVSLTGLAITGWAISQREYTGYILGVLAGIFLVLLFSTILPEAEPPDPEETSGRSLTFLVVFFPGLFGLMLGVGVPALMQATQLGSHKRATALTIAGLMALVISAGYLMLLASNSIRMMIAVFMLATAIGVLLHSILSRQSGSRDMTVYDEDYVEAESLNGSAIDRIRQRRRRGLPTRQRFDN